MKTFFVTLLILTGISSTAQVSQLPPLLANGDNLITSSEKWETSRRGQILHIFGEEVYGHIPPPPAGFHFEVTQVKENALTNGATMKEVTIWFDDSKTHPIHLLIFLPVNTTEKVPAVMGLNFKGNQSVHPHGDIMLCPTPLRNDPENGIIQHTAAEASRGVRKGRFPVERITDRGYAFVTACYEEIDPDYDDLFKNGVHALFPAKYKDTLKGNNTATISAWAWGLMRMMDYLAYEPAIDTSRVILFGHSRLGKAALWAGANDERFEMVISNNSGCGGAALSKRKKGETVADINKNFPHWFNQNFKKYNNAEENLPLDQHMLLALIAPRLLYVASAEDDFWADPEGEFLALKAAEKAFHLYGYNFSLPDKLPPVNYPLQNVISYHIRTGPHDLKNYDWEIFLNAADKYLK